MGRRPTTIRNSSVPILAERRSSTPNFDAGAFNSGAPAAYSQTARALALTAGDIQDAKQRRDQREEGARRNAVKSAMLRAKLARQKNIDANRMKFANDPTGYQQATGLVKGRQCM